MQQLTLIATEENGELKTAKGVYPQKKYRVQTVYENFIKRQKQLNLKPKTQKEQIVDALQTPMTVNQLYRYLKHISPDIIAPLLNVLYKENIIYKTGERDDTTLKGVIVRKQVVWSSRKEDYKELPKKSDQECINLLQSLFGPKVDVSKLRMTGYVVTHLVDDAERGVKTRVK